MTHQATAQEYLQSCHTRQLLQMRNNVHRLEASYRYNLAARLHVTTALSVTGAEIKRELDTREHIPNKAEAKLIRQQQAKEKKHR